MLRDSSVVKEQAGHRVVRIPGAHVSAGDSPVTPGLEGRKRRSLEPLPG